MAVSTWMNEWMDVLNIYTVKTSSHHYQGTLSMIVALQESISRGMDQWWENGRWPYTELSQDLSCCKSTRTSKFPLSFSCGKPLGTLEVSWSSGVYNTIPYICPVCSVDLNIIFLLLIYCIYSLHSYLRQAILSSLIHLCISKYNPAMGQLALTVLKSILPYKIIYTFPVPIAFIFVSSHVNLLLALVHFHICFLGQV